MPKNEKYHEMSPSGSDFDENLWSALLFMAHLSRGSRPDPAKSKFGKIRNVQETLGRRRNFLKSPRRIRNLDDTRARHGFLIVSPAPYSTCRDNPSAYTIVPPDPAPTRPGPGLGGYGPPPRRSHILRLFPSKTILTRKPASKTQWQ